MVYTRRRLTLKRPLKEEKLKVGLTELQKPLKPIIQKERVTRFQDFGLMDAHTERSRL